MPVTMLPLISKESAVKLLTSSIPEAEWLLGKIESEDGWFRFPPNLTDAIKTLKIESYPLLYENEYAIAHMLQLAFFTEKEVDEFNLKFEAASVEERGKILEEFTFDVDLLIESVELPKTSDDQAEARERFNALSKDEQTEAIRFGQRWYCFFFCSFFQNVSMMVHGERLTSLVAQAKSGDDDAFVKAVQIDRRILMTIPYFRDRFIRAQDEGDVGFSDKIAYRLKCAPYRGKIRFKSLWLAFSYLDQLGLLNTLTHSEILEICDQAGVGDSKNCIHDVKSLTKCLKDYRMFQQRG
jgi:hypothetical protein